MNVALRKPMTLTQFLAWEARQAVKFEFDGFQPVAMAGGTAAHSRIQRNLAIAIGGRLRGKPCEFHGSDLKLKVAGRVRYPDGFVICSPLAPNATVASEPVVIFEILSEGTTGTDLVTKNAEYAATPSVCRYVVLAQDAAGGETYERAGEDWTGHPLRADSILHLPEIGIAVPVAEFYEGVDLTGAEAAAEP